MNSKLLAACLLTPWIALALDEELIKNPSAMHSSSVGHSSPLVDLPAKVQATEGVLTLWADFEANESQGVPLYLVNKTNEDISLDTQDRDLYIKLEYQDTDGSWKRAQVHMSSWCGNSYYPVNLPARQFFKWHGYRPAEGELKTVRYAKKGSEFISNTGKGRISKQDLDAVATDHMTAGEIPWGLRHVLDYTENPSSPSQITLSQRTRAVRTLAWYPRNEPALRQVLKLQAAAISMAKTPERDDLLAAIEEFRANLDKPCPSTEELNQLCIARISADPKAHPAMSEETAWELLKVPTATSKSASRFSKPETWRGAIAPAVARMKKNTKQSLPGNEHAILSAAWIVDAIVPTAEIESWATADAKWLREIGATTLIRRSQIATLVKIARQMPAAEKIDMLAIMARPDGGPDARQPDQKSGEWDFWAECAQTMPLETAEKLYHPEFFLKDRNPFNRLIHDPLREYFIKEAASGTAELTMDSRRAGQLGKALQMLASWQMEEDDEVMTKLLKHGGYELQTSYQMDSQSLGVTELVVTKNYKLRGIARRFLQKRGKPLPENLETEKVLSRTPMKSF
ncbi:MAG: hypothetical protein IPK32_23370 [Verrucomicrobiaceae bacterium]|nr:hypothetical protein [Verrucomicrobiaceae bacterium]